MERGGNRFYVAVDQVGSPRVIFDAAGTLVRQIDYDSSGTITGDTNPEFDLAIGFAGGLADAATGLVRFGFRDYEPASGRWTARDPILFEGGQFNLYVYAKSNPVSLRDPVGLFCVGYHYYAFYGGGGKFCFNLDGTVQVCGEVGLAVGGGVDIDIAGTAKAGYSDYVKVEAKVGCGPVSVGGNVTLDDCGDLKICAEGGINPTAKFNVLSALGATAADLGIKGGAKGCYSYLDKKWKPGGALGATGKTAKENSSGRIKCKPSAGWKGGGCLGGKVF